MLRRMLCNYISSALVKIKGYGKQLTLPTPDSPSEVQALGREYVLLDCSGEPIELVAGTVVTENTATSLTVGRNEEDAIPVAYWKVDITGKKYMCFSCTSTCDTYNGGGLHIIEKNSDGDLFLYNHSDISGPQIKFITSSKCECLYIGFVGPYKVNMKYTAHFENIKLICREYSNKIDLPYTFNVYLNSTDVYNAYVARPLVKLGTNTDYMDNWGNVVRRNDVCTLDYDSAVTLVEKNAGDFYIYRVSQTTSGINEDSLCTHFVNNPDAANSDISSTGIYFIEDDKNIVFVTDVDSVSGFKQWLKDNPVKVYYKLKEDLTETGYIDSVLASGEDTVTVDDPDAEVEILV